MRGIPRNALKTRQDFELLQAKAREAELRPGQARELRRQWQALLDGRFTYEVDRVLADAEAPDGPEPDYRVVEEREEDGETVRRVQFKRAETDSSRLARLGYSVQDAEQALEELE